MKLVAETGQSLSRIIGKVGEINTLIGEIASGADGQSASLHEVNIAVKRMDEAVQQNAAMAEEASAAARALMQELKSLAASIDEFRVGQAGEVRGGDRGGQAQRRAPAASPRAALGAQEGDAPAARTPRRPPRSRL